MIARHPLPLRPGKAASSLHPPPAAIGAEALADFIYARALMDGTHELGGPTQLLWVASAGFIVWAAVDAITQGRLGAERPATRHSNSTFAQAAVPAFAIAIFMFSASASGAFGSGSIYVTFSSLLGLAFAIVAGLREHWIIHLQRNVHDEVLESRGSLSAVLGATSDSVIVLDRGWRVSFFNEDEAHTLREIGTLTLGATLWEAFSVDDGSDFRLFQASQQ